MIEVSIVIIISSCISFISIISLLVYEEFTRLAEARLARTSSNYLTLYVYIYIYRERERERYTSMYIYIYV